MFSDDTVRELFMMASSENSAPQRFLILWKLRRYPQNTVSLSFFLSEPPQKKKNMLSSENVAMLFIFLEAVLSYIYIYPKHPGNCLMYIQDILTAARTFC